MTAQRPTHTLCPCTQPQCFHSPGTQCSHSHEHPNPCRFSQPKASPPCWLLGMWTQAAAAIMCAQDGTTLPRLVTGLWCQAVMEKRAPFFPSGLAGSLSPTGLQAVLMPGFSHGFITGSLSCCSLVSPSSPILVLRLLAAGILSCARPRSPQGSKVSV